MNLSRIQPTTCAYDFHVRPFVAIPELGDLT
jgi:hypothetical protein